MQRIKRENQDNRTAKDKNAKNKVYGQNADSGYIYGKINTLWERRYSRKQMHHPYARLNVEDNNKDHNHEHLLKVRK